MEGFVFTNVLAILLAILLKTYYLGRFLASSEAPTGASNSLSRTKVSATSLLVGKSVLEILRMPQKNLSRSLFLVNIQACNFFNDCRQISLLIFDKF